MVNQVIRGGTVVDGTGSPPFQGDVIVDGTRIVAVTRGDSGGAASTTIDATGMVVAPGFIDPHTHLDAQLFWDAAASPSPLHGVTTAVIGNCGFGLAPSVDDRGEAVLRILEVAEEIPLEVMQTGVRVTWRSWAEYADALDALPLGLNIAAFVPHSPLRMAALGDSSVADDVSDEQLTVLVSMLEDALDAGALGLSSSRGPNHIDGTGRPVPSRLARDEEFRRLVACLGGRVWQMNVRAKLSVGVGPLREEVSTYAEWATAAGCRLTWTPLMAASGDKGWRQLLDVTRRFADAGGVVVPQIMPSPMMGALSFDVPCSLLVAINGWHALFGDWTSLRPAERRRRLADPTFRSVMRSAGTSGDHPFDPRFDKFAVLVSPSRPDLMGASLLSVADGASDPVDAFCDLLIADDLQTVLQFPVANDSPDDVVELLTSEGPMIGLSDAGAHVNSITNYSYPTHLLAHHVRDTRVMTLAEGVRAMTSTPADLLGLPDRGRIRPGAAADLCVIDLAALELGPTERRADLPAGGGRLYRGATGFRAVLVNGVTVVEADQSTGRAAGRLLRAS